MRVLVPSLVAASMWLWSTPPEAIADAEPLELRVELVGPTPLPFQGVRVRATIVNTRKDPTSGLWPLERLTLFLPANRAYAAELGGEKPVAHATRLAYTVEMINQDGFSPTPLGRLMGSDRLILKAEERETLAIAVSLYDLKNEPAIFQHPGAYDFFVSYDPTPGAKEPKPMTREFRTIARLENVDDQAVHRILVDYPLVARAMTHRYSTKIGLAIDDATARKLEHVILRYPKSSYGPYARFALARAYIGGNTNIDNANEDAKVAARTLLESITQLDWPFAPTALLWLERLSATPESKQKIRDEIDRRYADAVEVLAEKAEKLYKEGRLPGRDAAPVTRGPRPRPATEKRP